MSSNMLHFRSAPSLTHENIHLTEDSESGRERLKETDDFNKSFKDRVRERALSIYKNELNRPFSIDLGLHGVTRAALRTLCKDAVLQSSQSMRRRYSHSALSSSIHTITDNDNAISALRQLQKERLIVSRLGFPDRAMEIDKEIEVMREKAKKAREQEENKILQQRMKVLAISQHRKRQRLEFILAEETKQMNDRFKQEEDKLLHRQELEFLRVLENASRRAIGRVKKCNCPTPYTCRHNKTASYNTRRPTHTVVQYRRNAKRLRHAGRPEEAQMWEEKAKAIDEEEQERWRERVAQSIVSSPWGANEAAVDQITELHKKELAVLRKTHAVKRDMHEKKQAMRRKNFMNTMLAEERKVKMQCRKQALLRSRKDFDKEKREEDRQARLSGHSDGLNNISKNLLGMQFDEDEKKAVDWAPPTSFGLDNSVRLIDAVKEISAVTDPTAIAGRILTSKKDIKALTPEQLRDKIHSSVNRDDNSDQDSDSDEGNGGNKEKDDEDSEEEFDYKLGSTSGSKLVDKMRKAAKTGKLGPGDSPATTNTTNAATPVNSWQPPPSAFGGVNPVFPFAAPAGNPFGGNGANNGMMSPSMPFLNPATSPFGSTPSFSAPWIAANSAASPAAASMFPASNPFATGDATLQSSTAGAVGATHPVAASSSLHQPAPTQGVNPSMPVPTTPTKPSAPPGPAPSAQSFRAGLHLSPGPLANPSPHAADNANKPMPSATGNPIPFPNFANPSTMTVSNPNDVPGKPHKNQKPPEYVFDPIEDTKPVPFKPGSVKDIDWREHDLKLAQTNGVENSYGVPIVLTEEEERKHDQELENEIEHNLLQTTLAGIGSGIVVHGQGTVDRQPVVFEAGHIPPVPGTVDSLPGKSVLSNSSHYGKKGIKLAKHSHGNLKKVTFGDAFVRVFEPVESYDENDPSHQESPSVVQSNEMDDPVGVTSLLSLVALKKLDLQDERIHYKKHHSLRASFDGSVSLAAPSADSSHQSGNLAEPSMEEFGSEQVYSTTDATEGDALASQVTGAETPTDRGNSSGWNAINTTQHTQSNTVVDEAEGITAPDWTQQTPSSMWGQQLTMPSAAQTYSSLPSQPQPLTIQQPSMQSTITAPPHINQLQDYSGVSSQGQTFNSQPIAPGMFAVPSGSSFEAAVEHPHNYESDFERSEPPAEMVRGAAPVSAQSASTGAGNFASQHHNANSGPSWTSSIAASMTPSFLSSAFGGGQSTAPAASAPNNSVRQQPLQADVSIKTTTTATASMESLPLGAPGIMGSTLMTMSSNSPQPILQPASSQWAGTFSAPFAAPLNHSQSVTQPIYTMPSQSFGVPSNGLGSSSLNVKPTGVATAASVDQVQLLTQFNNPSASGEQMSEHGGSQNSQLSASMRPRIPQDQPRPSVPRPHPVAAHPNISTATSVMQIPLPSTISSHNPISGIAMPKQELSIQSESFSGAFAAGTAASSQPIAAGWNPSSSIANHGVTVIQQPAVDPQSIAPAMLQPNPFSGNNTFTGQWQPQQQQQQQPPSYPSYPMMQSPMSPSMMPSFAVSSPSSPDNLQAFNPAHFSFGSPSLQISTTPADVAANTAANSSTYRAASPRYGYGEGHAMDLSVDYTDAKSASTDDNNPRMKGGFNWELAFFRIANLDGLQKTLGVILDDDDLFEAVELYVTTSAHSLVGSNDSPQHATPSIGLSPEDHADRSERDEEFLQGLMNQLHLLRSWKRYQAYIESLGAGQSPNREDDQYMMLTENLVMYIEEVLKIEDDGEMIEHLDQVIQSQHFRLMEIYHRLSITLVPNFILSSDFAAYFETHTSVKAHNKKLRIDSKSWIGKFQRVAGDHGMAMHLFPYGGGRPYANETMRQLCGPMCDAPSPKEYIVNCPWKSSNLYDHINALMHNGMDDVLRNVKVRTVKKGLKECLSTVLVRHLRSYKNPEQIKFSLVIVAELNGSNDEEKLKILEAISRALPSLEHP